MFDETQELKIIGFYGYSGIGKTTVIESLVRDLTEKGWRVAVIKQSDKHIHLDTPGKDTDRFRAAGARATALVSNHETDLILYERMGTMPVIASLISAGPLDLVIVESADDPDIAKIRIGDIEERPNTVWTYDGDYQNLLDMIILS